MEEGEAEGEEAEEEAEGEEKEEGSAPAPREGKEGEAREESMAEGGFVPVSLTVTGIADVTVSLSVSSRLSS